jgi:predicted Rossmann-fold nucleotide-binding protein
LAWSLLQVGEIGLRPLTLLGDGWRDTIHTFFDPAYITEKDRQLLSFADSPETAVAHIVRQVNAK